MAAVIRLALEPRRLRTLATFSADDPWTGGRAEWDLELHALVPKGARLVEANPLRGKDLHGLRARGGGVDRFLPEALSELWKRQLVPGPALPRLLAEIEPTLRSGDFTPLLHMRVHRWLAAFFGLLALVLLGLAVRAATTGGHSTTRLPLSQWLARPQVDGEDLVTDRPVTIAGTARVAFEPRLPRHLFTFPAEGRYVLVWFPSGAGHRLLLAAEEQAPALPHLALTGVTLRPESIGVPAGALADLRGRVPGLDTSLVTGLFWTWTDISSGGRVAAVFFGGMALVSALGGAVIYLMIGLRQARRRRQMAWLLARP